MESINLLKYNRHWEKGFRYSIVKKRELFDVLKNSLYKKQIVEVSGLRRTGKTYLFFQLMDFLLENGVNPFAIWYFTFDEDKIKLDSLFENFIKQSQIDFKKQKVYIFLDEIQKLDNFQSQLKVYYDLYSNAKFFISGSTSLFVRKKIQESLAGRIASFFLPPLNFKEYLHFKEKEEILKRPSAFKNEIEREFEIFLESQLIESIIVQDLSEKKQYFLTIIKKIVFEDIPQVFPVDNPEILWAIVKIIGQHPGMIINLQDLSKEIGISNKTLSNYLFYLEESFLIRKVYNFSRNLLTSEKKLKRYYLASPSFSAAISDFNDKGKLAENFLISLKDYRFFWRDVYKHEVDFIEIKDGKIIPIEVKYKNIVTEKDFNNLILFSKKFKIKGIKIKTMPLFFEK